MAGCGSPIDGVAGTVSCAPGCALLSLQDSNSQSPKLADSRLVLCFKNNSQLRGESHVTMESRLEVVQRPVSIGVNPVGEVLRGGLLIDHDKEYLGFRFTGIADLVRHVGAVASGIPFVQFR